MAAPGGSSAAYPTERDRVMARWGALKQDRCSGGWDARWKALRDYILPFHCRFEDEDWGKLAHDDNIQNSSPREAAERLAAGMVAGITSPARPWFRLITADMSLMDDWQVRRWLADVEERIRLIFHKSNLYTAMPVCYLDLAVFGVNVLWIDEDLEDVIRIHPLPVGSYWLGQSDRGSIDTIYRLQRLSVSQLYERYGDLGAGYSQRVRDDWTQRRYDRPVRLLQVVEPNPRQRPTSPLATEQAWQSAVYELDCDLPAFHRGGYRQFPALAPRWTVTGTDVYGHSPGMKVLGDVMQLQWVEERVSEGLAKLVDPALALPASIREQRKKLGAGDVVYYDAIQTASQVGPIHAPNLGFRDLAQYIEHFEQRIRQGFYNDLFLSVTLLDRSNTTAREIEERSSEKMLQLGPVLERLQDDLLDPLVQRTVELAALYNQLPPPPEVLLGQEWAVEHISILAQAQRMMGLTGLERLAAFGVQVATIWPEARDKFSADAAIEEYAAMVGTSPKLLRSSAEVERLRRQQQAAQQQAQALAAAKPAADAARSVGQLAALPAPQPDNALNTLLASVGAPGVPGAR